MPSGKDVGLDRKIPLILPSEWRRRDGRGARGGEKMRRSEDVGRIKYDSSDVMMGCLICILAFLSAKFYSS